MCLALPFCHRTAQYRSVYSLRRTTVSRILQVPVFRSCVARFRVWNASSLVILTAYCINAAVFCIVLRRVQFESYSRAGCSCSRYIYSRVAAAGERRGPRARPSQCESVVGQLASGDEVCVATDALRKPRFSANFSDHKRASGSRLRARSARAGLDSCAVARRAATLW
eukprot:COSAG06_NODE_2894_length_6125_cov_53.442748_3_plen_168_part_00